MSSTIDRSTQSTDCAAPFADLSHYLRSLSPIARKLKEIQYSSLLHFKGNLFNNVVKLGPTARASLAPP